jgi:CheY-like chemotaxis protein
MSARPASCKISRARPQGGFARVINLNARDASSCHMKTVILLAEDSADDQWLFRRSLYQVAPDTLLMIVCDGEELLCYLKGEGIYTERDNFPLPSLLMLDLKLPKVDGLQILRIIKDNPSWNGIRVAVVSGTIDPEDQRQVQELGGGRIIRKPVSAEDLRREVARIEGTNNPAL